jgi:hypothetical protein
LHKNQQQVLGVGVGVGVAVGVAVGLGVGVAVGSGVGVAVGFGVGVAVGLGVGVAVGSGVGVATTMGVGVVSCTCAIGVFCAAGSSVGVVSTVAVGVVVCSGVAVAVLLFCITGVAVFCCSTFDGLFARGSNMGTVPAVNTATQTSAMITHPNLLTFFFGNAGGILAPCCHCAG